MKDIIDYQIIDNKFYVKFTKTNSEIDFNNVNELHLILSKGIEMEHENIYIDCKNLSFVDSTGLGLLTSFSKKIKIILLNVPYEIKEILNLSYLNQFFHFE